MVVSTISGVQLPVVPTETPKTETVVSAKKTNKDIENIMGTEEYVRTYFKDIPVMIEIAKCESRFRHLDDDGEIHRGTINTLDVGVMQINEYYHLETAQKENYNIYSLEGNTAYARKLYEKEGTAPWKASKPCWGKTEANLALNK